MPTARVALLVVAGMLAYFGLAVLGWGGFAAFFSHPARVALAVVTFVLTGAALVSGGVLSAFLPAYTDRTGFWTLDGDAVRWPGVFLYAAGGALRIWPVFVLGRRFSGLVAIQPGHALATDGAYGVIRRPSYLGLLVLSAGWALAFRSGAGLLLVVVLVPALLARIRAEEALLRERFGGEYDAYRARTWRLLPGLY